jgi:glyoxylase-like metal-dependent hydrolase (beta-lactamase superfamily II)
MKSFRSFYAKYLFLLILSVVPVASAQDPKLPPVARISEASKLDKSQAGYYRMKIGKIDVIALTDGTIGVDFLQLLTNTKPGEVESLLAREYLKPTAVEASMNAYLIQLDNKLVLVDTGAGELLGPKLDKLPDSLRSIGIQPEQITDILLTHIHPDHSGGLTVGGRRIFPNATVHVNKLELDYWTDKSLGEKAPEPTKSFFQQVDQTVTPYIKSGQVKTFDGEVVLFPGLRTVAGYGHTPGQTYYVLESNGEKLAFWGDTVHVQDVQFADPSVTVKFDVDPKAAAAQRKLALADAAKTGYLVALDHAYFPGVGHVQKEGDHFRWIPVPYIDDSQKAR